MGKQDPVFYLFISLLIEQYDFEVGYKKRCENEDAEAISRIKFHTLINRCIIKSSDLLDVEEIYIIVSMTWA